VFLPQGYKPCGTKLKNPDELISIKKPQLLLRLLNQINYNYYED